MTPDSKTPKPGCDGGSEPVDAPEAPVSGFEEERAAYAAEHPESPESGRGDEAERLEGDIAELQSKAAERDEYVKFAEERGDGESGESAMALAFKKAMEKKK